jgi:hypothetical protein
MNTKQYQTNVRAMNLLAEEIARLDEIHGEEAELLEEHRAMHLEIIRLRVDNKRMRGGRLTLAQMRAERARRKCSE